MRLILAVLLLTLLPQNAHAEQTLEEKILTGFFASFYSAEAFDEVCNKSSSQARSDMENKENVRWHDNMKMLVARISKLQLIKNPDITLDEALDYLRKSATIIKARSVKVFEEKGCDSEIAVTAGKALQMYRAAPAKVTYDIINREIRSQGGKVTDINED